MAATKKWWIRRGETVYGPFAAERLQAQAQTGRLKVGDEIRAHGDERWIPVTQVRQLQPYLKPPATTWFVQRDGATSGPFTSEALRELAAQGALTTNDLVRRGVDGAWVPATRLQGVPLAAARIVHRAEPPRADRPSRADVANAGPPAPDEVGAWRSMQSRLMLLAALTIGPFLLPSFGAAPSLAGVGLLAAAVALLGGVALRWTFAAEGRAPSWSAYAFLFTALFGTTTLLAFVDVVIDHRDHQIGWQNVPMWLTKQIGVAYHHATESDAPVDTVADFLRRLAALFVSVGFFEELLKLLPLAVGLSIQPTLDRRGCLYVGAISGLGFGLAEGLWRTLGDPSAAEYALSYYVARFCGGSLAHAVLSALAAYCAWQIVRRAPMRVRNCSPRRYSGAVAAAAAVLAATAVAVPHALYDACMISGFGGLAGITLACCLWACTYAGAFGPTESAPNPQP